MFYSLVFNRIYNLSAIELMDLKILLIIWWMQIIFDKQDICSHLKGYIEFKRTFHVVFVSNFFIVLILYLKHLLINIYYQKNF